MLRMIPEKPPGLWVTEQKGEVKSVFVVRQWELNVSTPQGDRTCIRF